MSNDSMAQKIKELRQKNGQTLEEIARKVGVGKSTVRKWETGMIQNMRRDKIYNLAQALHTTPAYLMGWENDSNPVDTKRLEPQNSVKPCQAEFETINLDELIRKQYDDSTVKALSLYVQLDLDDKAEIRAEMKLMLKDEKYSIQKELFAE